MDIKRLIIFFPIFLFFLLIKNVNGMDHDNKNSSEKKLNISDLIFHHVSDSHEWVFIEKNDKNKKIFIPLPIIIWDNGLEFFLSNNLTNGKIVKSKNHHYYRIFNDVIYQTNHLGYLNIKSNGSPNNHKPLDLSITKNTLSVFLSFIFILFTFVKMKNNYKISNGNNLKWKIGIFLESIIIFIRNEVAIPYIGKDKYKKYFPFLLSSFFFILINNLMGIIPMFPNVTGNINMTLILSIIVFIISIINSNKSYWKHILWIPGVPIGIKFLLTPIELIGIFVRPLTLSIRLFANIIAGHIIILSFICLIFIFKNIFITGFSIFFGFFISLLEIMVSFLQSFIFTTLSALIIGTSIKNYK